MATTFHPRSVRSKIQPKTDIQQAYQAPHLTTPKPANESRFSASATVSKFNPILVPPNNLHTQGELSMQKVLRKSAMDAQQPDDTRKANAQHLECRRHKKWGWQLRRLQ